MSLTMWKACKTYRAETRSIGPKFQTFSRVVHLDLDFTNPTVSLLPLHGFSHALKPLHVEYGTFPFPRILNLINSFPLLEDLWLMVWGGDSIGDVDTQPAVVQKVQPPLTGFPETWCAGRDESHRLPAISPSEWPSISETGFEIEYQRRHFRGIGVGRGVPFYPWISRGLCWRQRYVRSTSRPHRYFILLTRDYQVPSTSRKRPDSKT